MQIPTDHVRVKGIGQLVQPLDKSQGPSRLHGHGPWLMYEVALANYYLNPNYPTTQHGPRIRGTYVNSSVVDEGAL